VHTYEHFPWHSDELQSSIFQKFPEHFFVFATPSSNIAITQLRERHRYYEFLPQQEQQQQQLMLLLMMMVLVVY